MIAVKRAVYEVKKKTGEKDEIWDRCINGQTNEGRRWVREEAEKTDVEIHQNQENGLSWKPGEGENSRKRIEFGDVRYPRSKGRNHGKYLLPLATKRVIEDLLKKTSECVRCVSGVLWVHV